MTYKAQDVAEWLIYESCQRNIEMTHMKLQKLLYYAQGYSLGMSGEPLFSEEIQAWRRGPVVPVVYKIYNKYGSCVITDVAGSKTPEEAAGLIRIIFDDKGNFSAAKLSEMTHEETPWKNAYEYGGMNTPITNKSIEEYFTSQFWTSDEEDDYQPAFDTQEEEKKYFLERITKEELDAILA